MTPAERVALGLGVAAVIGGAIVVSVRMLIEIWRERRADGEIPCSICGEVGCCDLGHLARTQERLNGLHKARLIQREVVEPAERQASDLFRFHLQRAAPYDWRADRAFSTSGRMPRP